MAHNSSSFSLEGDWLRECFPNSRIQVRTKKEPKERMQNGRMDVCRTKG